ncbi:MAG: putative membrane protein [Haloquadratum sp. J07HQX50]|nr:MAG: putative membrane protein [Haloquadratum sp. J07HQX50]
MSAYVDRTGYSAENIWAGGVLTALALLIGGSILAPETVYDSFIWHYFWGPVQADANSAFCAIRPGQTVEYLNSASACAAAAEPVAFPGYTLVSEIGYMIILITALVGVIFLLQRLQIGTESQLFYALVPFIFFGGALRVVEDANDTVMTSEALISYPLNTLLISPVIYFTVFIITLVCVILAVTAARSDFIEQYERMLFALGWTILTPTVGYLFYLSAVGSQGVEFYPQVMGVVAIGATLAAGIAWFCIQQVAPFINDGTEQLGFVILWGHAVDGVANVVGLDWMPALQAGPNLVPKHPVNQFVVDLTGAIFPASIISLTGDTWPFLIIKLVAATFVIWVFEPDIFEESPRYTILLLIAVLAVGLGPGTRDVIRATFGV